MWFGQYSIDGYKIFVTWTWKGGKRKKEKSKIKKERVFQLKRKGQKEIKIE